MGSCIVVTSGKGGVGKTTCSANIGYNLACLGKKILCIDFDTGLRNLDILLGVEDFCVFDLSDIILNNIEKENVIVTHPKIKNLNYIAAPGTKTVFEKETLSEFIKEVKKDYDYVIIDCPAGIGIEFDAACDSADIALIITTPDVLSVRDVNVTADLLEKKKVKNTYLIVNRVVSSYMGKYKDYFINIDDIIDSTRTRLLGIVGEDKCLYSFEREDVNKKKKSLSAICYQNIARRLIGEKVSLFRFWKKRKYRK